MSAFRALLLLVASTLMQAAHASASPQRVVSLNLCTDQLLMLLADREQIASVSWLAADPEESAYADLADGLHLNHGLAEQVLPLQPDLVLAGTHTAPYTVALLERLGYPVLRVEPATSLEQAGASVRRIAAALGHPDRGAGLEDEMTAGRAALAAAAPDPPVPALMLQTGGFTVGEGLAHELMTLAGLDNLAVPLGLDRWGSLSVEALLRLDPAVLVMPGYRAGEPSLANAALAHPALAGFVEAREVARPPSAWLGCETPALLQAAARMQAAARAAR